MERFQQALRADAGDVINDTITALNAGNVTLTNVTVVDPLLGTLSCTPTQPATLAPGASIDCTGSYTLLQSDINAGERANTATADSSQTPPTETPNVVPVPRVPAIDLAKTASVINMAVVAPDTRADAGDTITYSFLITNIGNVTLTGVDLTDALVGFSASTCGALTELLPGGTTTCPATYTLTQAENAASGMKQVAAS